MGEFEVIYHKPKPLFVRPKLLAHPHIPSALAGVNPRTIKGQAWWDVVRRKAYAENNHCCWACGAAAGENKDHPALEAHETYDTNYREALMVFKEVVALCHMCHSFIHSGRLAIMGALGKVSRKYARHLIDTRMELLLAAGGKPFYYTRGLQLLLHGSTEIGAKVRMAREGGVFRPRPRRFGVRWRMAFEGKEYASDGKNVRVLQVPD